MITLFRRIRQKLIDSGSVTKYILYASGEIFLVVIGILIALQVNNWNEEQGKNKAKNILITEIKNDLQTDLNNIRQVREDLLAKFNDGKYMANFLESGEPVSSYDENRLNEAFMEVGTIKEFTPITLSFNELVSTGLVNRIIQDTLKILLFEHYNLSVQEEGILRQRSQYSSEYADQRFYYAPKGAFIEKNKATLKVGTYSANPFTGYHLDWEKIRKDKILPMYLDRLLGVYIGQQYLIDESEKGIRKMLVLIETELDGQN